MEIPNSSCVDDFYGKWIKPVVILEKSCGDIDVDDTAGWINNSI